MTHVRAFAVWWISLFFLWLVLEGTWNRVELIAAGLAAAVAAAIAEVARTRARVAVGLPVDLLSSVLTLPFIVVADFALLVWALPRQREGVFRRKHLVNARRRERRAIGALLATYSPNAYVVDVDRESGETLFHDLIPWERSESPL